MGFMKWAAVAGLCVSLGACESSPGSYSDAHTGVRAGHSKMYSAHASLLSNLNAAAFVAHQGGETKYAIGTRYSGTGVGWANFTQAWSFGTRLPYTPTVSRVAGCGSGCTVVEEGVIELTKAQFDQASRSGIEFKLIGSGADVIGRLPASAFQEALAYDK